MLSRKPKIVEETMKQLILTPNSSVKSSTTMESNPPSESRDTFYFPDCRKDANCKCDICIASINATLDLMPQSNYRSSLTKLSVSRPAARRSPVSFRTDLSTPESSARIRPVGLLSQSPISSESSGFGEKAGRKGKRGLGFGGFSVRCVLGLILVCGVDFGLSWVVSRVLKAGLSPEMVMGLGENSKGVEGLNGKFVFLEKELEGFVGKKKVSSCSSVDSVWKISEDGLLLNSRCVLYKSMSEEVSIWGWPLQTAGLLTAGHSFRSFTVISGRVTEWSNAKADYFVRAANCSWTQAKWSSSVMQLDPNTWILEYKRGFFLENAKLFSTAFDFLKLRLARALEKIERELWLPLTFTSRRWDFTRGRVDVKPT